MVKRLGRKRLIHAADFKKTLHGKIKQYAHGSPQRNTLYAVLQWLDNEPTVSAAPIKYGLMRTEAKIAIPAFITSPYYCKLCDMQFAVLNDKPEAVMHCLFCGAQRGEQN